jgi:hypothetical protein
MGHQIENLFALVTHQGQLVEGRLGGRRVVAFDLVFDGFDQRASVNSSSSLSMSVGSLMAGSSRKGASLPAFSA